MEKYGNSVVRVYRIKNRRFYAIRLPGDIKILVEI